MASGGWLRVVDCHRHHRGPYTGTGDVLRALVPEVERRAPDVVARHALTLLSIAPELGRVFPVSAPLARSFLFSREGNARFWTLRLAQGAVDFLLAATKSGEPSAIAFENVHAADPLDLEVIAVLLRRSAPADLFVSIGSSSCELAEPLASALRTYARVVDVAPSTPVSTSSVDREAQRAHALAYVESDCTADDDHVRDAYQRLDPRERREWHLARAAHLESLGERTLSLGAVPLHRALAGAPDVGGLLAASAHCMRMGYYESCLDLAERGLALVDAGDARYADFGRNIVFSLLLLERFAEVKTRCRQWDARGQLPSLRSHCAYATAILHARLYPPERRDYEAARSWIGRAIEFAELAPASETKITNLVFLHNTLALVELRTGHPARALDLLTDGLSRLKSEAPGKGVAESAIILHNRARIHTTQGEPARAIADYGALLELEPTSSEAHLDRGILHYRAGRFAEALDDFEAAIVWSPPYDEAYFNRAQALAMLGRKGEAFADYSRVLELEPGHLAALVNRAALALERGELDRARLDVDAVLAASPRHAKALCLLGLVEMAACRQDAAYAALCRAIECDGAEATAWINRATILHSRGESESALRDLDRALALGPHATAHYNRARILETLWRWDEAIADYANAADLDPGFARDAARRSEDCRRRATRCRESPF
jgi:tetratricopeptide (TPR) repeat protein